MTGIRGSLESKDPQDSIIGRVFTAMVTEAWPAKEYLSICDGGNTNIRGIFQPKEKTHNSNFNEPSGSGGTNLMAMERAGPA